MKIRLASYNILHCLDYRTEKTTKTIDYDAFADAIRSLAPDVIGLNEVRDAGTSDGYDAQARILSEKTGLKYFYFAEAIRFKGTNPYGNALLSKYPIVSSETIGIPDPDPKGYKGYYETRCVGKVKLDIGGGRTLTVLTSHFGLNPDEQENAVKTVLGAVEPERCALMGDFNVKPDNPVIAGIRERMTDTADAFREPLLSIPSEAPRVKIDYIFVSPDIKVLSADIPDLRVSDHRPHVAEIEI